MDNAEVRDIAIAPDGKEVEELAGKEVLMCLRKTISVKEYLRKGYFPKEEKAESLEEAVSEKIELTDEKKEKLKEIFKENLGKEKALLLDSELNEIKSVSMKGFGAALEKIKDKPKIIIIDGVVTKNILSDAEEAGCQIIAANNFAATSDKIKLLSF